MLFAYSILLATGFLLMLPAFLLKREKYAAGFGQRLGNYPDFKHDGRNVIWLHCVSVGETNAARPLVDELNTNFRDHRLVVSTTTKTGQELAQNVFKDKADAVIYFPFDFKFAVRRALSHFKPSVVLLMETEIWPRFIHEAKADGATIAIVNGRLSERSVSRYKRIRPFISRVLKDIDLALMQGESDANRLLSLGMPAAKTIVTGNLKMDQSVDSTSSNLGQDLDRRFALSGNLPLIIAASTHEPEEERVIEALDGELGHTCRLLIAPRHPERFEKVASVLSREPYSHARRSEPEQISDKEADIILLDSIGELREVLALAEIVFVGGSLIEHGGQSVIEPAIAGKAIVTGPYTANFSAAVEFLRSGDAIRQTPTAPDDFQVSERLYEEFTDLLENPAKREELGRNAAKLMATSRGATARTITELEKLIAAE